MPETAQDDGRGATPFVPVVRSVEPFDRFYAREFRSVVGLAYALSGSRSGAEDLAQEAFIAAHKQWAKIGAYDKPEAWVRRVVSNLSVSRFRRRASELKAMTRLAGFRSEHATIGELPAEAGHFWAQVRRLPKRQAQAVALHYLEDLPIADIADILDCSPSTVKVHLHKGRQTLAERLDVQGGVL
ncbi:MAG: SigE family RNA polymerase sigma factor [Acidimicrobiia bacterium]